MHSQWVASPIAPTMRKHSCSSTFLTARASIIGDMPSVQVIPFSSKILIMLMSMKSQPSFWPHDAVPLHLFDDRVGELVHLLGRGRTGRALIQANEWRTFSFGIQGECRSIWKPRSPCSNRIGAPSPHSIA